jgi:hypothetical protein
VMPEKPMVVCVRVRAFSAVAGQFALGKSRLKAVLLTKSRTLAWGGGLLALSYGAPGLEEPSAVGKFFPN